MAQRVFEIRVKGEMTARLRVAFEDVDVSIGHSITCLRVVCGDSSALHGILDRIAAYGLELLDVRLVDDGSTA